MKIGQFTEYKNYVGSIEYSSEDKCYHGKLLNISDLVNYEADAVENLYEEFHKAVDDYIDIKRKIEDAKNIGRLTRKSKHSDMVWFVDHENNDIDLEPCEMGYTHNKLAIQKLAYYEELEEEGRLIVLSIEDINPCRNCDTGWGSISSNGHMEDCTDSCIRLKKYNEKYKF